MADTASASEDEDAFVGELGAVDVGVRHADGIEREVKFREVLEGNLNIGRRYVSRRTKQLMII